MRRLHGLSLRMIFQGSSEKTFDGLKRDEGLPIKYSLNEIGNNDNPREKYDEQFKNDEDVTKADLYYMDQPITDGNWRKDWPTADENLKSSFMKKIQKNRKFGQIKNILSRKSFMILPVNSLHVYTFIITVIFIRTLRKK